MIDRDDAEAIARLIEQAERRAFAGALRFEAGGLRMQAAALEGRALVAEEYASAVERGEARIPQATIRLGVIEDTSTAASEPEDDEPDELVQRITPMEGSRRLLVADGDGDPAGEDFTPAMMKFVDLFDDRLRTSAYFVAAVNEAADAGLTADSVTAQTVAERIRELTEGAAGGKG